MNTVVSTSSRKNCQHVPFSTVHNLLMLHERKNINEFGISNSNLFSTSVSNLTPIQNKHYVMSFDTNSATTETYC